MTKTKARYGHFDDVTHEWVPVQDPLDTGFTLGEDLARTFVIGKMKGISLPQMVWEDIYLSMDGFGKIDRAKAVEQCWDWSHVRDSRQHTFVAAFNKLVKLGF